MTASDKRNAERPRGALRSDGASTRRSRSGSWLWGAPVVGALGLVLGWTALRAPAVAPVAANVSATRAALELLPQDVATVELGSLQRNVPLTGTLQPLEQTQVNARLAGVLAAVQVRAGDAVRRDQVLARLDDREFRAQLREKSANRDRGQEELALAERQLEQRSALFARELISAREFDAARTSQGVAGANLRALEAQLEQAREALADAVVRSPIDGIVAERLADPGSAVAAGAALFRVVDLSTLELAAMIPASDIPGVRIGTEARFRVEGFADQEFRGRVERINPATDRDSRAIAVYLRMANPAGELRAGMFAQGAVQIRNHAAHPLLPVAALHEEDGQPVVYAIERDAIERRPIQLGARDPLTGRVEVAAGLAQGARVIVGELGDLLPGRPVRLVEPRVAVPPAPLAPASDPLSSPSLPPPARPLAPLPAPSAAAQSKQSQPAAKKRLRPGKGRSRAAATKREQHSPRRAPTRRPDR